MSRSETWFTISPIKGYIRKSDYEIIDNHINEYLSKKSKSFKRQKFILIVVAGFISTKELYNILKDNRYSKTYEIEKIANESKFLSNGIKLTIGKPY